MPFELKNGRIHLDISLDDYQLLMLTVGIAAGAVMRRGSDDEWAGRIFGLADHLNDGNPDYTPYSVQGAADADPI